MSANNYLIIRKKGKEYIIARMCADITGDEEYDNNGTELSRTKTLKSAVAFAQSYQEDNLVEYGIHFDI